MLLTIGVAHQAVLQAQLTGTGAVETGSGEVQVSHGWAPSNAQRQNAEIIIAGVHDEIRSYTRTSQPVAGLHASAADERGFLRELVDEIARWFGLID